MSRHPYVPLVRTSLVTSLALFAAGCGLGLGGGGIDYAMEPQEFVADLGTGGPLPKFPSVACTPETANLCDTAAEALPAGATVTCDTGIGKCVGTMEVHYYQLVDLSQQKSIPPAVANSSVISHVEIEAIRYWVVANSLNVASPPISLYVGPQTAQKPGDPGVELLGTIPSLAAGQTTACGSGAPGTQQSACDLQLTEAGKGALGRFAQDIHTPFSIIVSATVTVRPGDPVPAGKVDFFVQPVLSFVL